MSSEITLKHIAEVLGISVMTVSRALNNRSNVDERTRERVLEKAKEMRYTPNHVARSLVSDRTNTIGVVIPKITHSFFPQVVKGIEEVTNSSDFQLFLINANEQFTREKRAIQALHSKRVEGLLISSTQRMDDHSFYKGLIKSGIKLVFFDRCIKNIGISCVSINDRYSSKKITDHLIDSHGYTKIAHISGPQEISTSLDRLQGYLDAVRSHELPINKGLIVEGGFQEKTGYESMKKLLSLSRSQYPEGVVAVNDPVAIGAINAIRDEGLSVPDDIAIVGFTDDIRAPLLETPLTTVHQPAYEMGKRAAKKLIQTITDPNAITENIEVHATLKIRESCGFHED